MPILQDNIPELDSMKKYPETINYKGNLKLLMRKKVSIVGTRHPNNYTKQMTQKIASGLALQGICIVSGGAMGVDALAHRSAGMQNTIMVAGTGIDVRYPKINAGMIENIEDDGLVLSQFPTAAKSNRYNFPLRNELVVALGDILIVTQADMDSGTMRSVEYALKMGKEVFVLSHRVGESEATNLLLQEGKAKPIYNIESFVKTYTGVQNIGDTKDDFLLYCASNPSYEDALKKYPDKIFEAELNGTIEIKEAIIYAL